MKKFFYGFLAVVLIAILSIPFIHWESLKKPVLNQLEQTTGCQIELTGPIQIKLFPTPQIVLQDVSIKPVSQGIGRQNFSLELAKAQKIAASWAWKPLLTGQLKIYSLSFYKPLILLKTSSQKPSTTEALATSGSSSTPSFSLETFSIESGQIHVDADTSRHKSFEHINLKGSIQSLKGPFQLSGQVEYQKSNFKFNLKTGLVETNLPLRGSLEVLHLNQSYGPLLFDGFWSPQQTSLNIQIKDLFVQPLPDPLHIQGKISCDNSDLSSHLVLKLKEDPINLVSKTDLESLVTTLSLSSPRLTYDFYEVKNFKANLTVKGQDIQFSHMEGRLYEGDLKFKGHFRDSKVLNLQGEIQGLDLTKIPTLKETPLKKGFLNSTFDLTLSLLKPSEYSQTLSGTVTASLAQGIIKTFDMKALVHALKNTKDAKDLFNVLDVSKKKAPLNINSVRGTFYLTKGIAQTQNLELLSDDGTIHGEGYVDLNQKRMDMLFKIKMKDLPKWPEIPLNVKGPFEALDYNLDPKHLANLVTQEVTKHVFDKVVNQVGKGLSSQGTDSKVDKPQDLIKGLIGGLLG